MNAFGEYMSSMLRAESVSADTAAGFAERYPWFSAARMLRAHLCDTCDDYSLVTSPGRGVSSLSLLPVDVQRLSDIAPRRISSDEIIDKFLLAGGHRIVADEAGDEPLEEIRTEPELSDDEDLVSEELAEIYLSQGLRDEAVAIYRKLSLLNTEKSIYFAEIIDAIEKNNN